MTNRTQQEPTNIWRFYSDVLWRTRQAIIPAVLTVRGVVLSIAFILAVVNRPIGKKIADWEGISAWWALVPIAVLLLYAILNANYQKFNEKEKQLMAAQDDRDEKAKALRELESGPERNLSRVKQYLREAAAEAARLQGQDSSPSPGEVFKWRALKAQFIGAALGPSKQREFRGHCEKFEQLQRGGNNPRRFLSHHEDLLNTYLDKLQDPSDIEAGFQCEEWLKEHETPDPKVKLAQATLRMLVESGKERRDDPKTDAASANYWHNDGTRFLHTTFGQSVSLHFHNSWRRIGDNEGRSLNNDADAMRKFFDYHIAILTELDANCSPGTLDDTYYYGSG